MKNKITPTKLNLLFQNILLGVVFFLSANLFAQPTITKVSPTRITVGSTVTIKGTGFTASNTVTINGSTTGFNKTLKNSTTIELEILASKTGAITVIITGTGSGTAVNTDFLLDFVPPVPKDGSSNVKISKIYTDFNGFWASGSGIKPNNSHDLLGFEYNNVTYSTGVNDVKLKANIGATFTPQYYRAFSTRGVLGQTHSNLFLAMADLIDGTAHTALADDTSPNIAGLTCYDVLVDGANGLDLGTGVTNFNTVATVLFTSDHAQAGPSNDYFTDNIPDVVLTQIAQPNGTDYYYFIDALGNVVGNPVSITMSSFTAIASYILDLFTLQSGDINSAIVNGVRGVDQRTRDLRLLGLRFSDFGINATNYSSVNSLSMAAGGGADLAFMAYNTNSFLIEAPHVVSAPNPVNICKLPYSGNITFSVSAGVDGGGTAPLNYKWKRNNIYISGATSSSYTINGPFIGPYTPATTPFATYKVEISNDFGAIVAASAVLKQGGVPAVWDGSSWNNTPDSTTSLIFTSDYNTSVLLGNELQGCDCTVNNNVNVIISPGDTMVLQNFLKVSPATIATSETVIDESTGLPVVVVTPAQPAGNVTIKNNGSLVQINETVTNEGQITYQRKATNLKPYDYVYWSSPVSDFKVFNLASATNPHVYKWNPNILNSKGSFGNWETGTGDMESARGYISRVSNGSEFTVDFKGVPNNGIITKTISGSTNPIAGDSYWYLLGNPYPSPINAVAFLEGNKNVIEGYVKIWSHGTAIGNYTNPYYQDFTSNYNPNDYITFNALTAVPAGFNGYIASGQGFFIKGKTANSGDVTFQNLLRYKSGSSAYGNGQFYRQANEVVSKSIIWLSLLSPIEKITSSIAVGYIEEATLEKDRLYDASSGDDEDIELFSIIDNSDEKFVIQGRPAPFEDTDIIPLGFKVTKSGNYTIVIDKTLGVFESNQDVFLEDKYLNVVHDLKVAPYNFIADKGNFKDRFNIKYTNTSLGVNDFKNLNAIAFIANNKLNLNTVEAINSFAVYDISGKLILNHSFDNKDVKEFSRDFNYTQGVYLVKIKFTNGETVTKKLIK